MSLVLRPADARGHANHGWLDSYHTFSFADYFDPAQMGFRALRVINDDVVRPGTGFGMHGHRDMEIVSYVVAGALTHEDTIGSKGVLRRGDVQYMNAGSGIRHSEVNASTDEDVRLLQVWIEPPRPGLPPSYRQETVPDSAKRNNLRLIAGPEGSGAVLTAYRDVRVYAALLESGLALFHPLLPGRGVWIQVVDGTLEVNGVALGHGDGAAIEDEETIRITATGLAEFLLFDLD